ncbi:MAG: winged helix-turn-helix domain-containing protein [Vicinamibacterales bacterium]
MSRFRFADVELDLARFEVTRGGRRLSLEPKAVDVLRHFVERPGRLVTRDELLDAVWPGVAVTPNALTRVIAQLRRELGDDASEARVIETVPTRGYRFIAAVEASPDVTPAPAPAAHAQEPSTAAVPSGPPRATDTPTAAAVSPHRLAGWALVVLVVVVAVAAATWRPERSVHDALVEGALVAVEGESGSIHSAVFSPDGRWLAVVSDRSGDFEIYLRDLDQPTSRPVTADGMRNVHPTWSPDSRFIAYFSALRRGIWVVPVAGGVARQVSAFGSRPAWSPDGRWIAFMSDEFVNQRAQPGSRIWMVRADGGSPVPLTEAGEPPGGHGAPMWSPDGTSVYFGSVRNVLYELWSVRLADRLLTRRLADSGPLFAQQIIGTPTGPVALGMAKPPGETSVLAASVGDLPAATPSAVVGPIRHSVRSVSLAPGGARMAIVQVEAESNGVWVLPVTAAGAPAGEARRLADGGHPVVSPDGRRVAYDRYREVRIINLDGTGDRALLTGGRANQYPSWIDDRRLVALRRTGLSTYLTEVDVETGTAVERIPLPDAASHPRMGPDGDTFLATVGERNTLIRGSLSKGAVEPYSLFDGYSFAVWSPDGRSLALEHKQSRHMLTALADVATGTVTPLSPPEGQYWPGGFSPDGTHLVMATLGGNEVWNVEVVDVRTRERRPLTRHTSPEHVAWFPNWSPRGDLVVYQQTVSKGSLWIARPRRPTSQ